MIKSTFSERLNLIIKELGIRQIDLCQKTGIGKSAMSQYLHGSFEPKQQNLHALAEALDVSEAWLMGYEVPRDRLPQDGASVSMEIIIPDNSMAPVHLPKGALVTVRTADDPADGDIICFSYKEHEKHFRYFHRSGSSIMLTAADPAYPPMIVDNIKNLQIYGIAAQVKIKLK